MAPSVEHASKPESKKTHAFASVCTYLRPPKNVSASKCAEVHAIASIKTVLVEKT